MRSQYRAAAFAAPLLALALSIPVTVHAQSGVWRTLHPMATARTYAASGVIGGKMVVTGGCCILLFSSPYTRVSSTEMYDPSADAWQLMQSIPTAVHAAGVGVIGGKLYVAGGSGDQTTAGQLSVLQIFDPLTNVWSTGTSMPQGLEQGAAGVIDGKLYVAGGASGNGQTGQALLRYDPVANSWSTALAPMHFARDGAAGAVVDGKFYVVGGLNGPSSSAASYLNVLEVYDPATDQWSTRSPAPTARYQPSAAVIDGILYVVGGQGNQALELATVEAYNPATDTWSTLPPTPSANLAPAVAAIGNTLYAAGGLYGSGGNTQLGAYLYGYTVEIAKVQQPINPDGTSVFSAKRGVIPVKFARIVDGTVTCVLPPATIALTRTAGGDIGSVDESIFVMAADSGIDFRIADCAYVYNLAAQALGAGTYRVDIKIGGVPAGSATFGLR